MNNSNSTEDPIGKAENITSAVIMLLTMSVLGVFGNSVVVYVYWPRRKSQTAILFIITLAVSDFFASGIIMPFTAWAEIVGWHMKEDFLCRVYVLITTSTIPYSIFIMTIIAIDRYICICHPWSRILTHERARNIVICFAFFALSNGVIPAIQHSVFHQNESSFSNESIVFNQTSTENVVDICTANLNLLPEIVYVLFRYYHFGSIGICCLVISVSYVFVFHAIIRRKQRRRKSNTKVLIKKQEPGKPKSTKEKLRKNSSTNEQLGCEDKEQAQRTLLHPSQALEKNYQNDTQSLESNVQADETFILSIEKITSVIENYQNDLQTDNSKKSSNQGKKTLANIGKTLRKKSTILEQDMVNNIRIAATLFIVTVVFIIFYVPSSLTMLEVISTQNLLVYYSYFFVNILNPIIYSIFNVNFREDLFSIINQICMKCNRR